MAGPPPLLLKPRSSGPDARGEIIGGIRLPGDPVGQGLPLQGIEGQCVGGQVAELIEHLVSVAGENSPPAPAPDAADLFLRDKRGKTRAAVSRQRVIPLGLGASRVHPTQIRFKQGPGIGRLQAGAVEINLFVFAIVGPLPQNVAFNGHEAAHLEVAEKSAEGRELPRRGSPRLARGGEIGPVGKTKTDNRVRDGGCAPMDEEEVGTDHPAKIDGPRFPECVEIVLHPIGETSRVVNRDLVVRAPGPWHPGKLRRPCLLRGRLQAQPLRGHETVRKNTDRETPQAALGPVERHADSGKIGADGQSPGLNRTEIKSEGGQRPRAK